MNSVVNDVFPPAGEVAGPLDAKDAVLLIGYGNLLRSDDGVGPAIVSRLAARFSDSSFDSPCRFMVVHQLMPELADDIQHARRVLFIDASLELKPGHVEVRRIAPPKRSADSDSIGRTGQPSLLGHHLSPESLLALTQSVYHETPHAWIIAIGIANSAVGDRLSPPVCLAVARLSHLLAHRIRRWTRTSAFLNASKDTYHACS